MKLSILVLSVLAIGTATLTFEQFPGVGEMIKKLIKKVEDLRDDCQEKLDVSIKECDDKKKIKNDAKKELDIAKDKREKITEDLVKAREDVARLEKEEVEKRVVVAEATAEETNAREELKICTDEIEKRVPEIDACNDVLNRVKGLLIDLKNKQK